MAVYVKNIFAIIILAAALTFSSFSPREPVKVSYSFPYKQAGLTERQAAAHLLGRFTYGAQPGSVDLVVKMGLEKWFQQQLDGKLNDSDLATRLSGYDALNLTNSEAINKYVNPAQILKMADQDGVIDRSQIDKNNKAGYRRELVAYMQQKGLKPQRELLSQFINQKVLRAAYSNNQLREVLTDFWFNHFNVSMSKNICTPFVPAYERDVIRPNVTGKFEDLLLATAKSPAMLLYLDNFSSAGADTASNPLKQRVRKRFEQMMLAGDTTATGMVAKLKKAKKAQGLNENYAREVMELHTLGVDGGYTQKDVTEAARVLTGWTVYPSGNFKGANAIEKVLEKVGEDRLAQNGFVHEGDFLFAANRHDKAEKTVLGKTFKNGGYAEGVELLKMIANHPSAASFISKKIAVRFVSDNPPKSLLDKMTKTYLATKGDISQVLITMVSSPEFWSRQALRQKTKSPFELAISAARSLNADITMPTQLYNWVARMGQKLYYYQDPTGFPDKGQYWINTGALLNRINFGLAITSNKIPGVKIDLLALNNGHEPESSEVALALYSKIVMPERDLSATVQRLMPLLHDPQLEDKVNKASAKMPPPQQPGANTDEDMNMGAQEPAMGSTTNTTNNKTVAANSNNMMAQVVGIIIGSPEFQRR